MYRKYDEKCCILCGSKGPLSGEHKIKRTQIINQFGKNQTFIGNPEEGIPLRLAQGPKSKEFHFKKAKICVNCNGSDSQSADREFDIFCDQILENVDRGTEAKDVFLADRYQPGTVEYLNVFRYFAKILCCHMAEISGPTPVDVANFAIGKSNANYIRLEIKESYAYERYKEIFGDEKFSHTSHGGLIIFLDKKMKNIECFLSIITISKVHFVFHIRLKWLSKLILRYGHRNFYEWCIENSRNNIIGTEEQKLWHGII